MNEFMESQNAINILVALNLLVSMSANYSGAKKGLKTSITKVVERPATFLQKVPPNIAALVLILTIVSIFKIGSLTDSFEIQFESIRITGLIMFLIFSWLQVWAYKSLGKDYAQDIVILKEHQLHTTGIYKFIRHPQYISQILSDLGAGLALLSFTVVPIVILFELPLFIMRASVEDKLLQKYFGEKFAAYKKQSGFIIPFIG
ncbi:MAG: isoprenylcysteine carboxylmethyltransferase family protein [Ignavibacteriales bacterium]|nr:MAG: isoprenylcysteine carboxylmethyltransferase family protein [Ignavibacteriales bacterium]